MRSSAVFRFIVAVTFPLVFAACAPNDLTLKRGVQSSADERGTYKVGQPYQIGGIWYYPKEDLTHVESGLASWYGPNFDGRKTANGETFDRNALTAAHPTLQLPSVVRVTNLRNGRTAVVRVNDRGPFSGDRILDLSERAAEVLGFKSAGTVKVKLEVLASDSSKLAELARAGAGTDEMNAYMLARFGEDGTEQASVQVASAAAGVPLPISSTARQGIFVQAGAFANRVNADRLSTRLSRYGRTLVDPVERAGNWLYRVRIGPFGSVDTAGTTLARLVNEGHAGARLAID